MSQGYGDYYDDGTGASGSSAYGGSYDDYSSSSAYDDSYSSPQQQAPPPPPPTTATPTSPATTPTTTTTTPPPPPPQHPPAMASPTLAAPPPPRPSPPSLSPSPSPSHTPPNLNPTPTPTTATPTAAAVAPTGPPAQPAPKVGVPPVTTTARGRAPPALMTPNRLSLSGAQFQAFRQAGVMPPSVVLTNPPSRPPLSRGPPPRAAPPARSAVQPPSPAVIPPHTTADSTPTPSPVTSSDHGNDEYGSSAATPPPHRPVTTSLPPRLPPGTRAPPGTDTASRPPETSTNTPPEQAAPLPTRERSNSNPTPPGIAANISASPTTPSAEHTDLPPDIGPPPPPPESHVDIPPPTASVEIQVQPPSHKDAASPLVNSTPVRGPPQRTACGPPGSQNKSGPPIKSVIYKPVSIGGGPPSRGPPSRLPTMPTSPQLPTTIPAPVSNTDAYGGYGDYGDFNASSTADYGYGGSDNLSVTPSLTTPPSLPSTTSQEPSLPSTTCEKGPPTSETTSSTTECTASPPSPKPLPLSGPASNPPAKKGPPARATSTPVQQTTATMAPTTPDGYNDSTNGVGDTNSYDLYNYDSSSGANYGGYGDGNYGSGDSSYGSNCGENTTSSYGQVGHSMTDYGTVTAPTIVPKMIPTINSRPPSLTPVLLAKRSTSPGSTTVTTRNPPNRRASMPAEVLAAELAKAHSLSPPSSPAIPATKPPVTATSGSSLLPGLPKNPTAPTPACKAGPPARRASIALDTSLNRPKSWGPYDQEVASYNPSEYGEITPSPLANNEQGVPPDLPSNTTTPSGPLPTASPPNINAIHPQPSNNPPTDVPPPGTPDASSRYLFAEPDTADNICYRTIGGETKLYGATLPKLVEKLTDVTIPDSFESQFRETIQFRVWFFVKEWINNSSQDFVKQQPLIDQMTSIIEMMTACPTESVKMASMQLKNTFTHKMQGRDSSMVSILNPPKSYHSSSYSSWMDVHPIEFARQLTLREFDVFSRIKPTECFGLAWTKKDASTNSPHILQMTQEFNKIGTWVVAAILKNPKEKTRQKVIKQILKICGALKDLHNYNGLIALISGLGSRSIFRLKKSWTEKTTTAFNEFSHLLENNYREMRELLTNTNPPCLPYLGIYLTDLTFIQEGNEDCVPGTKMINWWKATMNAGVIQQIQQWQQLGFVFSPVQMIQNIIAGLESDLSDADAYQLSLKVEPRAG
ncbi:cell division control protein [Pelomyxa schiedti]|nr:cell division control protein [Pelomyxa schiedti]